ncbi:MAG TPA: response regulator [Anaerolineae bacterium]|nr:response regulator [Anaerolineae bacterium]
MANQSKILIVEDNADTAEMLSAYFSAEGYDVQIAAWGREALKLCQVTVPDLIIQDIRLPDISGYDVVRELRERSRTSAVPVIFLTDRRGRHDRIAGLTLGAVDYIAKPCDMQELRLKVRNALRRASYASLVSPVTGLSGRKVAEDRLVDLLDLDGWAVLYVSILDIEPFNEAYGFVAGDDVLRAVGLILNNVIDEAGTMEDSVAHVDQTGFVVITQKSKVPLVRQQLIDRLARALDYFYPIKDREFGRIVTPMKAELGVAFAAPGKYASSEQVLDAARAARKVIATGHVGPA